MFVFIHCKYFKKKSYHAGINGYYFVISGDKLVYRNEDGSIREIEKNLSTYTASASVHQ